MTRSRKEDIAGLFRDQVHAHALSHGRDPDTYYGLDFRNLEKISERDAEGFLRSFALDLVRLRSDGDVDIVQSQRRLRIFSHGPRSRTARRITLSVEPILTIGAISWLHEEMGWPGPCMVTETESGAFDFSCKDPASDRWFIHAEVKVAVDEVQGLADYVFAKLNGEEVLGPRSPAQRKNWNKKVMGLQGAPPLIFWVLGPNRHYRIFRAANFNGTLRLYEGCLQDLRCPPTT